MKINLGVIIFIFLFSNISKSIEIKSIAVVNNYSISNYDLIKTINILEQIKNKKIMKKEYSLILEKLINDKIKIIEIEKNKIEVDNKIINKQLIEKFPNINDANVSKELRNYLFNDLKINYQWNILLNRKFSNKLTVNLTEIEEVMKTRNIPDDKKNSFILMEKNKKLVSVSNSYFNEVSSSTYVERFE